jgi:hypothetical protein
MEAVAAAEALLLGKRAIRRRPKDLDSIASSATVCDNCIRMQHFNQRLCAVGWQRSARGGAARVLGLESNENCDGIAGVRRCCVRLAFLCPSPHQPPTTKAVELDYTPLPAHLLLRVSTS